MNFWTTTEVDSWSRDFSYSEYRNIHLKSGNTGRPLSFDTYQAFCAIMDIEYEDSFK